MGETAGRVQFDGLETSPAFHYEPLQPWEVRFLKIEPGCDFDQVRCNIHHFDIRTAPDYVAVSYRWGSSEERIPVQIGGQAMDVMSNAWWALHYLRNHHIEKYLWIDAICIDQTNTAERNYQVRLMGKIFSGASEVVIWLGLEDRDTETAFELLRSVEKDSRIPPDTNVYNCALPSLERLLESDYWRRVWIVQELAVAEKLTLVCGEQRLTWDYLDTFVTKVAPRWKSRVPILDQVSNMSVKILVENRRAHRQRQTTKSPSRVENLEMLLKSFRHFNSGDVRDKVYALINLYNTPDGDTPFKIDYSRTVNELLMYTTSYLALRNPGAMHKTCGWMQELLSIDVRSPSFRRWLRPRLRCRHDGVFNCHLESDEIVAFPLATQVWQTSHILGDERMLPLEDLASMDISFWLDPFDAMDKRSVARAARWIFDNQDLLNKTIFNCPTAASFATPAVWIAGTAPSDSALRVIRQTYLDGAPLKESTAVKAVRSDTSFLGIVCSDAQAGDIIFKLVEAPSNTLPADPRRREITYMVMDRSSGESRVISQAEDIDQPMAHSNFENPRYAVLRPSKGTYTVVGDAILAPGVEKTRGPQHQARLFLDPLNAFALSAPTPFEIPRQVAAQQNRSLPTQANSRTILYD